MMMKHDFDGEWLVMIEDQPVECANRLVVNGDTATFDGHSVEITIEGEVARFGLGLDRYEVSQHAGEGREESFAVVWRNGEGDDEISDVGVMDRASLWADYKRDPDAPNVIWHLPVERETWVLRVKGLDLAHALTFRDGQVFEGETSVGTYETTDGRLSAHIGRSHIVSEKMYSNMTDFAGKLTTTIDGETKVETAHVVLRATEN